MKNKLTSKERLIAALDVDSMKQAEHLITSLKERVGMFKVGNQLFTSNGRAIIDVIKKNNVKLFLDLKYHDIPNTVAMAGIEAAKLGVTMFNVHALGGYEMMARCVEAVEKTSEKTGIEKPIILAVTILTSMSEKSLCEVGIQPHLDEQIILLAGLAEKAGVDGVVASSKDVTFIRENCKDDFVIVTPGIRPSWAGKDDHKRLSTPAEAIKNGADYLVIGRPIKDANDPAEAAEKIRSEIEGIV